MPTRVKNAGVRCRTLRGEMIDAATEPKLTGARISGSAEQALPWSKALRFFARFGAYDLAVTHKKEMTAIFKRLWKFKDEQPQRDQHLDLLSEELKELRSTLHMIK